jgi:hypothetical protein
LTRRPRQTLNLRQASASRCGINARTSPPALGRSPRVGRGAGAAPAPSDGRRVGDLPVPLAPDIAKRLPHLGAAVERPLPERLDIVGVEVQHRGGAADAKRRKDAQLGKTHRPASRPSRRTTARPASTCRRAPAGHRDAPALLGAEDARVPRGRTRRVAYDDVRGDRVPPFGEVVQGRLAHRLLLSLFLQIAHAASGDPKPA